MRHVGNRQEHPAAALLEGLQQRVELLDLLAPLAVRVEHSARVLSKSLQPRDFFTGGILGALERLHLHDQCAAPLVERAQLGEQAAGIEAAVLQRCFDGIGVVAKRWPRRAWRDPILAV